MGQLSMEITCPSGSLLGPNQHNTRENLGLITDTSLSGARVARELTAMIRIYGKPDSIVSDNGTEFTSTAILKWAGDTGVANNGLDQVISSRPAEEHI